MKRTPLYEEHLVAGGKMVEFAGWELPVQYQSIVKEHGAVRRAAGLFDVSHMGEIEVRGPDAARCCAALLANDPLVLEPGRAQYSMLTNEGGGVVDDVIVYRLDEQRFLICVNAANIAKDVAWITDRVLGDCRVEDRSSDTALLSLQGPAAERILSSLAPVCTTLERFAFARAEPAGVAALIARTGYTGEDGFELFVPAEGAVTLWRAILEAGRNQGVLPVGLGARDTLRLEAGLPLYGHELDDETSPYEAGLGWVVKLNRSELLGYEALRGARDGNIRKRLIGLEMEEGIARAGCPIVASGGKIGIVTSGSYGPWVRRAIALAWVDCAAALDRLSVEVRGKGRSARVVGLPFYSRGDRSA